VVGDWNWYLPSWLEWLPRVSHEPEVQPAMPGPADGTVPEGAEEREVVRS
jgi:hypothetical protein